METVCFGLEDCVFPILSYEYNKIETILHLYIYIKCIKQKKSKGFQRKFCGQGFENEINKKNAIGIVYIDKESAMYVNIVKAP